MSARCLSVGAFTVLLLVLTAPPWVLSALMPVAGVAALLSLAVGLWHL